MRRRLLLPLALCLLATACRASGPRREGGSGPALGAAEGFPPEVVEAERLLRAGRGDGAEDALVRAGGMSAAAPERSWLLVELLGVRCATADP